MTYSRLDKQRNKLAKKKNKSASKRRKLYLMSRKADLKALDLAQLAKASPQ